MAGRPPIGRRRTQRRALPKNVCRTKKRPYESDVHAKIQLSRIMREDQREHKVPVRAYKCEFCPYWHLTSKPDRNKKG